MALTRSAPMKRTAWKRKPGKEMKRTGGLDRSTKLNPKRATPRRSSRVRDEPYLDWCRRQETCGLALWAQEQWVKHRIHVDIGPCGGCIDPDHERKMTGGNMKASDRRCWPVCRNHHDERHGTNPNGFFGRMAKAERIDFISVRIDESNARYDAELAADRGLLGGM